MIDFELDEEQKLLLASVSSFAGDKVRPLAHEADESSTVPEELVAECWSLGLIQAAIPEAHGGYGAKPSALSGALVAEALAEGDLAIAMHLLSPHLVVDPLIHLGSREQQASVLPAYSGENFTAGSAAVLEPGHGLAGPKMKCSARRDGENWVLRGDKCCVPLAKSSPYIVIYAVDEEGLTAAFIAPAGCEGIEIGDRESNMGVRALETYPLALEDCRLPASARLGTDASVMLRRAAVARSAMAVGVAKASLDYAIDYAKEREAFGQKIGQKQAIAFMLAEMAIEVEAARLLNWEAAWCLDEHGDGERETALAKRYASDTVMAVTDNGIQVLGGHGFVRDHPVELWARNGRGFGVFEGMASV